MQKTKNGGIIIKPGSDIAKELDLLFTKEFFSGYLSKKDNDIYVSMIISKKPGEGNFRKLLDTIEDKGYTVKVPTPFPRMEEICKIRKYTKKVEDSPVGKYEVYVSEK